MAQMRAIWHCEIFDTTPAGRGQSLAARYCSRQSIVSVDSDVAAGPGGDGVEKKCRRKPQEDVEILAGLYCGDVDHVCC